MWKKQQKFIVFYKFYLHFSKDKVWKILPPKKKTVFNLFIFLQLFSRCLPLVQTCFDFLLTLVNYSNYEFYCFFVTVFPLWNISNLTTQKTLSMSKKLIFSEKMLRIPDMKIFKIDSFDIRPQNDPKFWASWADFCLNDFKRIKIWLKGGRLESKKRYI